MSETQNVERKCEGGGVIAAISEWLTVGWHVYGIFASDLYFCSSNRNLHKKRLRFSSTCNTRQLIQSFLYWFSAKLRGFMLIVDSIVYQIWHGDFAVCVSVNRNCITFGYFFLNN